MIFFNEELFIYLLILAVLGVHCELSLTGTSWGYSLVAVHGLVIAVASPIGEHAG